MEKVNMRAIEEVFGVNADFGDEALMDDDEAVEIAEASSEYSEEEVIRAWQHLQNTGLAYEIGGWFQSQVENLIRAGLVDA